MYLPKYHAFDDTEAKQMHIELHSLGAWVCSIDSNLVANHIPFFLDKRVGQYGQLIGHVSRANPVWCQMAEGVTSVVMFMGPQAYITPSWYPGKQEHGRVVPTWNYSAVHAHGVMRAIEDPDWILRMLSHLTNAQESARKTPWQVSDAPHEYIQKMQKAIVGIELTIERLEGRLKVSQDEEPADRLGTVEGLMQEQNTQSVSVAELVHQQIVNTPTS